MQCFEAPRETRGGGQVLSMRQIFHFHIDETFSAAQREFRISLSQRSTREFVALSKRLQKLTSRRSALRFQFTVVLNYYSLYFIRCNFGRYSRIVRLNTATVATTEGFDVRSGRIGRTVRRPCQLFLPENGSESGKKVHDLNFTEYGRGG